MYRVLIADDEPIERKVIHKKIREYFKEKLEVIEAVNGREAINKFENQSCHIVILDIEMPGINGLEAAERIREKDQECSIIFLTAFEYFGYAKKAITVRALDYLLKPSEDEELIAALEEAIRLVEQKKNNGERQRIEKASDREEITGALELVKSSVVQQLILEFIDTHYTQDIALQDLASEMNYSEAYFCKIFKQYFKKSFTQYLSELRVEKAKELLRNVTINVKEVSDQVGYRDSNYFTKVFKRIVGITPSEYRISVLEKKIKEV